MADIWEAARDGRTSAIKQFVASGVSLNAQDAEGNTPLHYAILNGCDLASEYIIDTTDDVNIKNAKGLSALLASIIEAEPTDSAGYSRKADAVEYLIQSGKVDLGVLDPEGRPALHRAIDYKSTGIIDSILKSKPAVNARNASGETALHLAVSRADMDAVTRLLKVGADASAIGGVGHTPLTLAIKNGSLPMVKLFVQFNADLNAPNQNGETPLIQSVKDNAPEDIVNALVSRKVRVNDADKDGNTALHWAIISKNTKYTRKLTTTPLVSVNAPNKAGATPLMLAVAADKMELAEAVLAGKPDVNAVDVEGDSALHTAARQGNLELIRKLMELGGNEKLQNKRGRTPYDESKDKTVRELFKEYNIDMWSAARKNDVGTVKKLIAQGADVNALDDERNSPLHAAAEKGHAAVLAELLAAGARVELPNGDGNTALHCALLGKDSTPENKLECVRALIKKGAAAASPDNLGYLPIHRAVAAKSASLVRELIAKLSRDAVDSLTTDGLTPLQVAAKEGDGDVCAVLLQHGAKAEVTDSTGSTPLLVACLNNNLAVAKRLVENGAKATTVNTAGVTPILAAMNHDNLELMSMLLSKGADANQPDKDGNAAIHIASSKGNTKVLKALLDGGAVVDVANAQGETPLMLAAMNKHDGTVDMLLQNKASLDLQDKAGNTALHYSASKGELDTMRRLLQKGAKLDLFNNSGKTAGDMNDHPQILSLFEEFKLINEEPGAAEDLIPCEYCNKLFSMAAIMAHQFNCTSRG